MKQKFKFNSNLIIILLIIAIIGVVGYGINYAFYTPSKINAYIATNLYKTPANSAFTDQNFYNCVVDAYNSTNNTNLPYTTNLSDSQLKTISSLMCYGNDNTDEQKIQNTVGIEKLTSLYYIDITHNLITSLNLNNHQQLGVLRVSNNRLTSLTVNNSPYLRDIYAGDNQLTKIDVSNNKQLEVLWLNDNYITDLNVINNVMLKSLDVSNSSGELGENYNSLTSLNVSKNSALLTLYADNTKITSLDVSNNKKLNTLRIGGSLENLNVNGATELKNLSVANSKLKQLNVSNNKQLEDLDIRWVETLTNLELSGATSLKSLMGTDNDELSSLDVSKNVALESLSIGSNQLTTLDVSKNTELASLNVSYNQLKNLDVSKNVALGSLSVNSNQLTTLDVSKNLALKYLNIERNELTNLDVSKNTALENLNVGENQLTTLDVSKNTELASLDVSYNQLKNLDVSKNVALGSLSVNSNQLTTLDISKNNKLNYLQIYSNPFGTKFKIFEGKNLSLEKLIPQVKLPSRFNNSTSNYEVSSGLTTNGNTLVTEGVGTYTITNSNQNPYYTETYTIEVIGNPTSDKYTFVDRYFVYIGTDSYDDVLENVSIENAELEVDKDNGKLIINKDGEKIDQVEIIKLNVKDADYRVGDDYIYVGDDTDEEILENLEVLRSNQKYEAGLSIKNGYVTVSAGAANTFAKLKIIRSSIDKYQVREISDFLYIGTDSYDDLKEHVKVTNGTFEVDEDAGYLRIMNGDVQLNRYEIIKLDIADDTYEVGDDYIYVGNSTDEEILENVQVIRSEEVYSNSVKIENGYLKVTMGAANTYENLKIIKATSSKYDLSSDYIYVGKDSDEEIINSISVGDYNYGSINSRVAIEDYVDSVFIYVDDVIVKRIKLVRLSVSNYNYDNDYIYVGSDVDEKVLNYIRISNGYGTIVGGNISYLIVNDKAGNSLARVELVRLNVTDYELKDKYLIVNENVSDDEVSWNVSIMGMNSGMSIRSGYIDLNYQGTVFKNIKIIKVYSDVYDIEKNYINVGADTDEEILNNVNSDVGELSIKNGRLVVEYGGEVVKGYVLTREEEYEEYLKYTSNAKVENIKEYNDILKHLTNNNTFVDVKTLIDTNVELSMRDQDNNIMAETSRIKTGTRMVATLSDREHIVYLSVKGDVTGNGDPSSEDVLKSYQILRGESVDRHYLLAADINEDDSIKINDVAKLHQYVVKKIDSLD